MFHLLNLAREDEAFVLMTARIAPSAFEVELRDLRVAAARGAGGAAVAARRSCCSAA